MCNCKHIMSKEQSIYKSLATLLRKASIWEKKKQNQN